MAKYGQKSRPRPARAQTRAAQLASLPSAKAISPLTATGAVKREWEAVRQLYQDGKLQHLTFSEIHRWCVENLGFTCGRQAVVHGLRRKGPL